MAAGDPVGPDNDLHLRAASAEATLVVAAWGVRGVFHGRSAQLAVQLGELWALALTKDGEPRHPLYVRADTQVIVWIGQKPPVHRPIQGPFGSNDGSNSGEQPRSRVPNKWPGSRLIPCPADGSGRQGAHCKTSIHRFESGRRLQFLLTTEGFRMAGSSSATTRQSA